MVSFKELLYYTFPKRFQEEDTYIDQNGKGLFQRYIETFGDEWDEELIPKLENYLDKIDVPTTDAQYLTHLAWFLGNPPDLFYDDARYRKFLQYIVDINKVKGTVKSYEMLFFLLGVTVTLTFVPLTTMIHDDALEYDDGYKYDEECPSCSEYDLEIIDPLESQLYIRDAILGNNSKALSLLLAIIAYVEPINLKLRTLYYDSGNIHHQPWVSWVLGSGIWDDNKFWDDTKIYKDNP